MGGGMRVVKQSSRFPAQGELHPLSPVSIGVLCEAINEHWQSDDGQRRFGGQIRFLERASIGNKCLTILHKYNIIHV